MARVTSFTAERMLEIENSTVVDGLISDEGRLLLQRRDGQLLDAGEVVGKPGDPGSGVDNIEVSYQSYHSGTGMPTGDWLPNPPAVPPGHYLWIRTEVFYRDPLNPENQFSTESFQVIRQGEAGTDGEDGVGIQNSSVEYQSGISGVTPPTGNWLPNPPDVPQGRYLWSRTTINYTNGSTDIVYAVSKQGSDGSDGQDGKNQYLHVAYSNSADGTENFSTTDPTGKSFMGTYTDQTSEDSEDPTLYTWVLIKGASGTGISSSSVHYASGTSATTQPSSGWSTSVPTVPEGEYLWTRSVINFTDGASQTSYSVAKQGAKGAKGDKGDRGDDGADGVGIASSITTYQQSSSGTTPPTGVWFENPPAVSPGNYLWSRMEIIYTNGSDDVVYSVSRQGQDGSSGVGISATEVRYASSSSGTTTPTTGWQSTIPTVPEGHFLWTRTVITLTSGSTQTSYTTAKQGEKGTDGQDGKDGEDGQNGSDGVGISSSVVHYAQTVSGSTTPEGGWQTTVPSPIPGQFIWTRTRITYTDGAISTSYSVARQGEKGTDGKDGEDGAPGTPGKGIQSTTVTYQQSTSGTTTPTGTWSGTIPTPIPGRYLWTRTHIVYTDGQTSTAYSVARQGEKGDKGDPGDDGLDTYFHVAYANSANGVDGFSTSDPTGKSYVGTYSDNTEEDSEDPASYTWVLIKGATGNGIVSSTVSYATSTSGTVAPTSGWTSSIPSVSANQFLWTRTTISFADGGSQASYSVAKQGAKGDKGAKGDTGTGITSTVVAYASNTSATNHPASGWVSNPPTVPQGHYLWTRTTINLSNGTNQVSYSVSRQGADGVEGASIATMTSFYQLTTGSTPSIPTTLNPPSPWTSTEPAYVPNRVMWRITRVVYSDDRFQWSSPSKETAYTAASEANVKAESAQISADGKSVITQGPSPKSPSSPGSSGDTHFIRNAATGVIEGAQHHNGTAWVNDEFGHQVIASIDFGKGVFGELDGQYLKAETIDATKMNIGDFANYLLNHEPVGTDGWTVSGGASMPPASRTAIFTANGNGKITNNLVVRVREGQLLTFAAEMQMNLTTLAGFRVVGRTGSAIEDIPIDPTNPTNVPLEMDDEGNPIEIPLPDFDNPVAVYAEWEVPAGVDEIRYELYSDTGSGAFTARHFALRRKIHGELLVDGTITGRQIQAESINTQHLRAGAVSTEILAANAVTAENIAAEVIDASHIAANSISVDQLVSTIGEDLDISSNEAVNIIVGQVGDVQDTIDTVENNLDQMQAHYRFTEEGLSISKPGSPYEVRITNDRLSIWVNGVMVSWWNEDSMHTSNFVGERVLLANHYMDTLGESGTIIRWAGEV